MSITALKRLCYFGFNFLIPQRCIICNSICNNNSYSICNLCDAILPWLKNCCVLCSNPLLQNEICGQCLKKPPLFQKSTCVFLYKAPASHLIAQLKFHHHLNLAYHLGLLLVTKLKLKYGDKLPNLVIPVPLHPQRLRQRGFNQALEITKIINHELNIAIDKTSLIRHRSTLPQTEVPTKLRVTNVANAFSCQNNLENLHVLLIDDVITTRNTIDACCTALQKAGVKLIDVAAIARTKLS